MLNSTGPDDAPPIATLASKIIENQEAPTKAKQRLASKLAGKSKLGNKQSLKPSELKTKVKKTKTRVDQNLGEVACPELKLVSGSGKNKKD